MAKNKKRLWITIGLIAIIGLLVVAAVLKNQSKPKGTEVKVEQVERRTIKETVSASGRVFPETEVKISSDVSGEIVELYVAEGDSVRAGQLLAKIDPETYISAVQRAEATVAGSKSNLAMSKASKQSSIAQKEQIAAQLKNAKRILERNVQLKADGIISEADYEQALANVENLEANLRAAEANIKSADQSIEGSKYNVESSEATLNEMKTSLRRTTITSPVDGVISTLNVEQGERVVGTIQMSGTEMMRIANLSSMEVQVDVSENDIIRVALGDNADIEVDAYLDQKFSGVVTEIANSASNVVGATSLNTDQVTNFIVKIRIDRESYSDMIIPGQKFPFRPGMSASVDIYTNEVSDVISVPIQAVTARELDEEGKVSKDSDDNEFKEVVFLFGADTVAMQIVKTGIQDDEYIQILEGLTDSAQVVTGPYAAISSKLDDGDDAHKKKEKEDDDDEDE